jgi:D-glycero-alpha-D-manno-heptose-7-phosphate kinase
MIVSRAPTRVTFAGGATDAKPYCSQKGGFLIAAGINKYIWMIATKPYWETIRLKYFNQEEVRDINEIGHPLFRESLRFCGLDRPIELTCLSDVPPNCGLGTSGTFTVSLLEAVFKYLEHFTTKVEIAEIASCIEIDILKKPIGKQDQYMATFGGLTCLTFNPDGSVGVERLHINGENITKLENSLALYDTNVRRSTDGIQSGQYEKMDSLFSLLDQIKDMAYETKTLLESGRLDEWGDLLNTYWQTRKKMSDKITLPIIDEAYDMALKNGALGGKIIGAGGGGFLMLYCPKNKSKLTESLAKLGLKELPFGWDYEGVKSYTL